MTTVVGKGKTSQKEKQDEDYNGDFGEQRSVQPKFEHGFVLKEKRMFRKETHIKCDDQPQNTNVSRKFTLFENAGKQCNDGGNEYNY